MYKLVKHHKKYTKDKTQKKIEKTKTSSKNIISSKTKNGKRPEAINFRKLKKKTIKKNVRKSVNNEKKIRKAIKNVDCTCNLT
jgi:hypothetical protein